MNRGRLVERAVLTLGIVSFLAFLWVFFDYHGSRPDQPHPESGRVYRSNNHGSLVYLTAEEATGLGLLIIAFMLAVIVSAVARRKYKLELGRLSPRDYLTLVGAAACYLAFIKLCGPAIATFAVSHGLIISWY